MLYSLFQSIQCMWYKCVEVQVQFPQFAIHIDVMLLICGICLNICYKFCCCKLTKVQLKVSIFAQLPSKTGCLVKRLYLSTTVKLAILKFAGVRQEKVVMCYYLTASLLCSSTNGVNTDDLLRTATDEQEALQVTSQHKVCQSCAAVQYNKTYSNPPEDTSIRTLVWSEAHCNTTQVFMSQSEY